MKTRTLLLLALFYFSQQHLWAQCGSDPASGLVTISSASQIVNSYYAGQGSPNVGSYSLTVGSIDARGNATPIAAGDLILIIQMQGANINHGNSNSYGSGSSSGQASGYLPSNLYAGNYEYNSVASVSGSTINLSFSLMNKYYTRSFSSGAIRSYQVIRIPRYYNFSISVTGSVTAPAWNGATGGVVAIEAANVATINGSINVNGLGFRGGGGMNFTGAVSGNSNGSGNLSNTDRRWESPVTNSANLSGGAKGEGIAGTPVYVYSTGSTTTTVNTHEGYNNGAMGRGAPANGGGGGTDGSPVGAGSENQYNTGGGGGGNAGAGGDGGSGWHGGSGNASTFPTGGRGGAEFVDRSIQRLVMGGGGGAGTANNSTAANQYMSSGAAGGGIILIRAKSYAGNGSLNANGANAVGVIGGGGNTDGAGGGGAGGTIVAVTRTNITVGLTAITANARGGSGGNMDTYYDHGPGGGGGGGMVITNGSFAAANINGGSNGFTRTGSTSGPVNNAFGATSGSNGELLTLAGAPWLQNANNATSPCGVLPVSLVSFRGSLIGSAVTLHWDVEQAVDFRSFEIEYSVDGSAFHSLGQTEYRADQNAYQYVHNGITQVNYYRLKMISNDGTSRYSNILVIKTSGITKGISVFPQPANDHITISLAVTASQKIKFQLYNTAGAMVKEITQPVARGVNLLMVDGLRQLPPGMYMLKTQVNGETVSAKVLLSR